MDLRADPPAGHRRLVQGPVIQVVGESHYRDAIEAAVGKRPEGHRTVVDVVLASEPDNLADPNAISVLIAGRKCGYLSRLDAMRYQPVMEWAQTQDVVPVVRGDVSGGWQQADGSWADFGIRLYVASPDQLLGRPAPAPSSPSVEHAWVGLVIAFTGDSRCAIDGVKLDRPHSEALARAAGMQVHPRVTKNVQLLVDCDDTGVSGNQRKATEYGIQVVPEDEFWKGLGLPVDVA